MNRLPTWGIRRRERRAERSEPSAVWERERKGSTPSFGFSLRPKPHLGACSQVNNLGFAKPILRIYPGRADVLSQANSNLGGGLFVWATLLASLSSTKTKKNNPLRPIESLFVHHQKQILFVLFVIPYIWGFAFWPTSNIFVFSWLQFSWTIYKHKRKQNHFVGEERVGWSSKHSSTERAGKIASALSWLLDQL